MNPKVSIIVPVHNAGVFFERCLNSLINQTLKDIEIILVLDCPTDGSDLIAERYAENDGRIRLIKNERNLNIGFSRNRGLDIAKGEFIGFMDHDDYCDLNMFEHLYNKVKNDDADIVISGYYVERKNDIVAYTFPKVEEGELRESLLSALIRGRYSRSTCTFDNVNPIWIELVKKEIVDNNNIRFIDNNELPFEDVLFNLDVYFYAKKIGYLSEVMYHHIITGDNSFGKYSYRSADKIVHFLEYLICSLDKKQVKEKYCVELSECVMCRLYSLFRFELQNKGLFKSLPFFKMIKANTKLQQTLADIHCNHKFVVRLPLTKRLFYLLIKA